MRSALTIKSEFICDKMSQENGPNCGKAFTTQSKLDCQKRIPTANKLFSCSQCDYKCTQSSTLKTHEKIHTGEKPFSCSKCDKKFRESGKLKLHKESTWVKNHSAAQSVTRSSVKQVI